MEENRNGSLQGGFRGQIPAHVDVNGSTNPTTNHGYVGVGTVFGQGFYPHIYADPVVLGMNAANPWAPTYWSPAVPSGEAAWTTQPQTFLYQQPPPPIMAARAPMAPSSADVLRQTPAVPSVDMQKVVEELRTNSPAQAADAVLMPRLEPELANVTDKAFGSLTLDARAAPLPSMPSSTMPRALAPGVDFSDEAAKASRANVSVAKQLKQSPSEGSPPGNTSFSAQAEEKPAQQVTVKLPQAKKPPVHKQPPQGKSPSNLPATASWASRTASNPSDRPQMNRVKSLPQPSAPSPAPSNTQPIATASQKKPDQRPIEGKSKGDHRTYRKNASGAPLMISPEKLACVEHKETNYNHPDFKLSGVTVARFFVIKSYSEDDVHKSVKYNIWTSTEHGNRRLSEAFRDMQRKNGCVYLFFSVNGSGNFSGIAEMKSECDFAKMSGCWGQEKWKGEFKLKWIFVKDVPNGRFKHVRLTNNENKPVTNSRDTQEVLFAQGLETMKIIIEHESTSSIFDDFAFYEKEWAKKFIPPRHIVIRRVLPRSYTNTFHASSPAVPTQPAAMAPAIVPIIVVTALFGGIGFAGIIYATKGSSDPGLVRLMVITTVFCMWLFWLAAFMSQINPLVAPELKASEVCLTDSDGISNLRC